MSLFDEVKRFASGKYRRPQLAGEENAGRLIEASRSYVLGLLTLLREPNLRDQVLEALGAVMALPPHVYQFADQKAWIVFPGGRILDLPAASQLTLYVTQPWSSRSDLVYAACAVQVAELVFDIRARGLSDVATMEPEMRKAFAGTVGEVLAAIGLAVRRMGAGPS